MTTKAEPWPFPALPRAGLHSEEPIGLEGFRALDRISEAANAQLTAGLSSAALTLALFDWSLHLARAPGKRFELIHKAWRKALRLCAFITTATTDPETPSRIEPLPGDSRFRHDSWQQFPYRLWQQGFLLHQQWWHNVTHDVPGVTPHHEQVISFTARQILDVFSPSNIPWSNPEILEKTLRSGGLNFLQGFLNWAEDVRHLLAGGPPVGAGRFVVGRDVAITPGKVVYRNHLIELIQYEPTTSTVRPEPILIVPAWIMKFYILDLSPHDSFIRYLVGQGFTVFCISWRNPTSADRDLTLDDYRRSGVMAALEAVNSIVPGQKVHAAGYCLGGTLLAVVAAAMARSDDDRLASITLFAAQTDFSEPGELALFIDHSQMHLLESMMWNRGYLAADQMAGAFQLLRSNDLVWSRHVHDYLMGERTPMNDLMAWNADSTRMPYRMHAEYLKRFYLDNELASGRFMVDDRPAAIQNIRVPMFVVGTERDHVAPWRSVYKIHFLADSDAVTFALTSGGHNAGIVSEPGKAGRHFRIATRQKTDPCVSADEWVATANFVEGSWWPAWVEWLYSRSSSASVPPPVMGMPGNGHVLLENAPGTYVLGR